MSLRILIVGCGKAGIALTKALLKEKHDITVMDRNDELVQSMMDNYDVQAYCGDALLLEDLEEVVNDNLNIIVAMTSSDEVNILCCQMAKQIGASHCVARVRNPMFAKQMTFMRDHLGISLMANPDYSTASEIARMIRYPNAIHVETFAKGQLELAEMRVTPDGVLDGMTLTALRDEFKIHLLICAVAHGEELVIPRGDFRLEGNDKIYATATHSDFAKFYKQVGEFKGKMRSVLIVGGGRITHHLIKQLHEQNCSITLIEQNREKCEEFSDTYPKLHVICGDGTDQDLLLEEGLADVDVCIPLTGIDEENMILARYAQNLGVDKVITKIKRPSLIPIAESLGIINLVSPLDVTAKLILQYVRGKQNSSNSTLITLYRLANDQLEAAEFVVRGNQPYVGIPLKDMNIPDRYLIAGIIRGDKKIIPSGEDTLKPNDSVVVVAYHNELSNLNQIFES